MKEIGKEDDELYILLNHYDFNGRNFSLAVQGSKRNETEDISLWHKRLGHTSSTTLHKMFPNSLEISHLTINYFHRKSLHFDF